MRTDARANPRARALPDQDVRDAVKAERARNVVIDAGAGTGKTTLIVTRLVDMLAPTDDGDAFTIDRIAAVTFTRRAAGELRLRIRERLLSELGKQDLSDLRRQRLHHALAGLDTAHVGTIHSFADRLLRRHPMQARLSPFYDVVEDEADLVDETWRLLLDSAQQGTLAARLAGMDAAARAEEAQQTVLDYLLAGFRSDTKEHEFYSQRGLDALVAGFIRSRDVTPVEPKPPKADLASFRKLARTAVAELTKVQGTKWVPLWMRKAGRTLQGLATSDDPVEVLAGLRRLCQEQPKQVRKGEDCDGDSAVWNTWKLWDGQFKDSPALRDDMLAPMRRWMALRLVRVAPVVCALYQQVKAQHQVVDEVDLLLQLRNLLRADLEVRRGCQQLFDHIFIDEFQDTDPLQAEIVLYLCERDARAHDWQDVELAKGRLTIVGDPKQSIYRFRRADVLMYDLVRSKIAADALVAPLATNFRSVPGLIDFFNDRFDQALGESTDEKLFDAETGQVFNQRLGKGRTDGGDGPEVRCLPLAAAGPKARADEWRALEAAGLARYLRWLIEASDTKVWDVLAQRNRPVRYGDVAVLAISTSNLHLLFEELDLMGVPYASRGGKLFLADELHRQFLLGLRAVADRDDGVTQAMLLRPPFFALDLGDLAHERATAGDKHQDDERNQRVQGARALINELRRGRFERSPGATARALLTETALGRQVALGANGAQRLTRLREICLLLEQRAAAEGLDYDAVTARLRDWVDEPAQLDPPPAVGVDAIQITTVHQAKGLEFPVVVLWDSRGKWSTRSSSDAWSVERDRKGWVLNVDGLECEEPAGLGLRERESKYEDQERRRVVYVAATRARDLLIVPVSDRKESFVNGLLATADQALLHEEPAYSEGRSPAWARKVKPHKPPKLVFSDHSEAKLAARWQAAAKEAGRPLFQPAAVSVVAKEEAAINVSLARADGDSQPDTEPATRTHKKRESRHGVLFGDTVHRALAHALSGIEPRKAVDCAAAECGLRDFLDEAVTDVERALSALSTAGIRGALGKDLFVEYPLSGPTGDGHLLQGYVDLLAVDDSQFTVIDFKTDAIGDEPSAAAFPAYVAQVRSYMKLLRDVGVVRGKALKGMLLFTQAGKLVEV
jgi:ATP-dependent helicase/nuclease subunit A